MPSVISPSSFMVGNAPGGVSYAAPLMDFSPLAKLPQDYYAGTQMARQQALQNAFPEGVPTLADGSPNIGEITKTLTRLGGAETAQALLPQLIDWQTGQQVADYMRQSNGNLTGGAAGGAYSGLPQRPRIPSGPNAGPASITGNQPQAPQGSMAQEGQDSIQSLTTELFGSSRNMKGFINQYSQRTGISPIAPLTPQQVQDFHAVADPIAEKLQAQAQQPQQPQQRPPQTPVNNEDPSSSSAPTSGTSAQERAINGGNAAPFVSSGASGAPGPVTGPGPVAAAPNAAGGAVSNPMAAANNPAAAAAILGPGIDWRAYVREGQRSASEMRSVGALLMRGSNPERGKALLAEADAREARVNRVLDFIKTGAEPTGAMKESAAAGYGTNIPAYTAAGKNLEFTPEQKQYASYQAAGGRLPFDQWQVQQKGAVAGSEAGGRVAAENTALTPEQKQYVQYRQTGGALPFDQWQVQQKGEVAGREARERDEAKAFTAQHQGITAAAASADAMVPYLKLAQGFLNDPNFYSGPLENLNLKYKQAIASFGGDPNKALPQEGFRKIVAEALGLQINNMKAAAAAAGMQSSRIFQSQIGIMREAQQNPESTIAANRTVTEIMLRAANLSKTMADMADTYKGGHLDAGFNMQLRRFLESPQGQLFTPEEIADSRLISPLLVKSPQDLQRLGWKDGTPFKTPDGRVFTHAPRAAPQPQVPQ